MNDEIEKCKRKLQALREEFDRLDANHPQQSVQIARDITTCIEELERLLKGEIYDT